MVKVFFAAALLLTGAWVFLLGWLVVAGASALVSAALADHPNGTLYQSGTREPQILYSRE